VGAPPRLTQIFEKTNNLTYFVTFCVKPRQPLLANQAFFDSTRSTLQKLPGWHIWCGVVMPDHVHLLISPLKSDHSVGNFSAAFKRWNPIPANTGCAWQKGCFDRLLRSDEHADQKWSYIRENPLRAALVSQWDTWPYRIDWTPLL
jgi:REP element-mobilizing transposase RayT